jgi:hypothetical protein
MPREVCRRESRGIKTALHFPRAHRKVDLTFYHLISLTPGRKNPGRREASWKDTKEPPGWKGGGY